METFQFLQPPSTIFVAIIHNLSFSWEIWESYMSYVSIFKIKIPEWIFRRKTYYSEEIHILYTNRNEDSQDFFTDQLSLSVMLTHTLKTERWKQMEFPLHCIPRYAIWSTDTSKKTIILTQSLSQLKESNYIFYDIIRFLQKWWNVYGC